ncbi:MAG: HAD family hydrolase [Chloroflexota bacterium]|nr:HAD family hydrolase [Chloroflexota bacterium]
MKKIRGVCFDFGDTLFHSPDGAAVIAEAGVAPDAARELWDKIWRDSKTPEALAVQRDLSPEAHRSGWTALFEQADVHQPGLSKRLYEQVMDHQKWSPYPDTEEVLRALRARGLRIGVVSNVAEDLRPVFVARGWGDLVDGYTHSYEHRIEKPDARIFLAACTAMGTDPSETLVVGDHPVDGGAVAAGCVVLLLPRVEPGRSRGLERVLALVG